MEGLEENSEYLTICIPTYNRGEKAKRLVSRALIEIGDCNAVNILVLDNASQKEKNAYHDIAVMAKSLPGLEYVRHEENQMAHGNFLACFELTDSPHIMIVADEDTPCIEFINQVQPRLSKSSKLSILRGSIATEEGVSPMNAQQLISEKYSAGESALLNFSLTNNYFSGTIYNRRLLIELGLVNRLKENLELNSAYPHLYLEILASATSEVETSADICCVEGAPQILPGPGPSMHLPPYSFGGRLDQFVIARDNFREALTLMHGDFDIGLFLTLYLRLCEKYFYLVAMVNAPMYVRNNINPAILCESLLSFFMAAIVICPEADGLHDAINKELIRIQEKYLKVWS